MKDNIHKTKTGYKAFVDHYQACNSLNKRLRQYKEDKKLYTFVEGEEGIFTFQESDYAFVKAVMKTYGCIDL